MTSQGRACSCAGSTRMHMHAPANAHMYASALVLRDGGGHGRRERSLVGVECSVVVEAVALGNQGPWGRRRRAVARDWPWRALGCGPLSGGGDHSLGRRWGLGSLCGARTARRCKMFSGTRGRDSSLVGTGIFCPLAQSRSVWCARFCTYAVCCTQSLWHPQTFEYFSYFRKLISCDGACTTG